MLGRFDQILPDRFLENVARNRGVALALHADADAGLAWLRDPRTRSGAGIFR